jgi:hypothetical protein
MDETTAAALYHDRVERPHEALAIETVALRALLDALGQNMTQLRHHVIESAPRHGDVERLWRAAGALAALDMLDRFLLDATANANDVTTAAVAEYTP